MANRRRQLDMAHALAPHPRQGDFHPAFFADDALVFHALVLAAQALVILDRPEDAGAEQPVPLRLESAVIDGFGLLDLTKRPAQNLLWRGDGNTDAVKHLGRRLRGEEIHDLLIHSLLLCNTLARCPRPGA